MQEILIVDHDPEFRTSLLTALAEEYVVGGVGDGRAAMQVLERRTVDAVLVDLAAAECDGFTVLGHIDAMTPRPRVVVLSSVDEVSKVVTAMRLGAADYLVKPCDLGKIRKAIRGALADRAALMGQTWAPGNAVTELQEGLTHH